MKSAKELQASCLTDEEDGEKKKSGITKSSTSKVQKPLSRQSSKSEKSDEVKTEATSVSEKSRSKRTSNTESSLTAKKQKTMQSTETDDDTASEIEKTATSKRKGFGAKDCYVNPVLADLLALGDGPYQRPGVVSKLWEYIRTHELQNPKDKREILLDEPLKKLLGVKKCTMFSINKHLTSHIKSLE
jgi:upstream activation factor subunit UAF30